MTNKRFLLGMLVLALVFGMMVAGCDSNSDTNFLDTFGFSTAAPSPAALSVAHLTQSEFDDIRDAAGGGFLGWAIDSDGDFAMAWEGRNESNFDSVVTALKFIRGSVLGFGDEDGVYYAIGSTYEVSFFSTRLTGNGFFIPSGTILANIE